ncbi:beta-N-acetylhexosaminidase [Haloechinothrix sp. LS1_15]|uniref:beta-N-acetylhexosaminidase n=1 Tax=Haloechinothrix sp. LS1_15 TaxID=2652248 RepID=UPI0029453555|nr:beta-N-acetylhexosaminidase [Haloechinothrix sp. LS1_15]MDV6011466.1 family 20 glycosylhydrolase [Haloechinothrix sp. LS1_15]
MPRLVTSIIMALALLLAACTSGGNGDGPEPPTEESPMPPVELPEDTPALHEIVPAPRATTPDADGNFELTADTEILVGSEKSEAGSAAEYLAELLRPATGFTLPVRQEQRANDELPLVVLDDAADELPTDGYRLEVTPGRVELSASSGGGFFAGVQSLRQLLPADVERDEPVERTWAVAGGTIVDHPRFAYRGAMLDVARHFFEADVVKRHIDRLAQYKINHLHLHLTDDQGWRIEIPGWPRLTEVGAANEVGGGPGGYYTQEEFRDIVTYAADRGITIVPEIDMPGHTNAALASYAELNCDGNATEPYTGTHVGFSSLCIDSDTTYEFAADVISEVAALTPGEFFHIGGDEAEATTDAEYRRFFDRVLPMITDAGKRPVGWHEYAAVDLPESAVVQYWRIEADHPDTSAAASDGNQVIMSPADHSYLDMKYHDSDPWGNSWAGAVSTRAAYEWDPATYLTGVGEEAILGVEAPLWTELVQEESDIERMAFPRTQAVAEVGWTPQESRDWEDFRSRLSAHGERMAAQGIDFHPDPEVDW